jgi:hypothetical protein
VHGDAWRAEDGVINNYKLHARCHEVQRKDARRVSELAKSAVAFGLVRMGGCVFSIVALAFKRWGPQFFNTQDTRIALGWSKWPFNTWPVWKSHVRLCRRSYHCSASFSAMNSRKLHDFGRFFKAFLPLMRYGLYDVTLFYNTTTIVVGPKPHVSVAYTGSYASMSRSAFAFMLCTFMLQNRYAVCVRCGYPSFPPH